MEIKDIRKDYPEFIEAMAAQGFRILGFLKIKCPAYCMHLDFTLEMKDPFFAYDRSICRCYDIKPDANQDFLVKLLGLGEEFFLSRKKYLLDNSYITVKEEDGSVYVSLAGHKRYISADEFQIEVESHKDILVDGRSFDMWSDSQKDDISEWNKSDKPDLCYTPISGTDDKLFDGLLDNIKTMDEQERKTFLGIDGRSKNFRFSTNGVDMCCIQRWIYIRQKISTGNLALDVFDGLGYEFLGNLNALTFGINKSGQLYTSTDTEHVEDGKNQYLVLPFNDKDAAERAFIRSIEKEYGMDEISHFRNESKDCLPIRLKVTLTNLQHSRNRSSLIAALKVGYHI